MLEAYYTKTLIGNTIYLCFCRTNIYFEGHVSKGKTECIFVHNLILPVLHPIDWEQLPQGWTEQSFKTASYTG